MLAKEKNDNFYLILLFLLGIILCLPMIFFDRFPKADASIYYLPMIRNFAQGNWFQAYYPMIPPLLPTIAGIISKTTHLAPYTASKLTTVLFFAGSVFPLYHIHRITFGKQISFLAVLLFLLCPRLMRYAGAGLLDIPNTFFLLSGVFSFMRYIKRPGWLPAIGIIISCAGLALIRGEGILFAMLLIMAFAGTETLTKTVRKNRDEASFIIYRLPIRVLTGLIFFFLIMSPWIVYQYRMTGYPVTDSRQIPLLKNILAKFGNNSLCNRKGSIPDEPKELQQLLNDSGLPKGPWEAHAIAKAVKRPTTAGSFLSKLFSNTVKGFYFPYLVIAIIAALLRVKSRKWTLWETFLLIIIFIHTAVFILILWGFPPVKRYISHALPFILGWTAYGAFNTFHFLKLKCKKSSSFVPYVLVFILIYSCIWEGTKRIRSRPSHKQKKIEAITLTARWIRKNKGQTVPGQNPRLNSTTMAYYNGESPIILTCEPRISFFVGGETVVPNNYKATFTIEEIVQLCKIKSVHFVAVEDDLLEICPEFSAASHYSDILPILYRSGNNPETDVTLLGYKPNLRLPGRLSQNIDTPHGIKFYKIDPPNQF